MYEYKKQNFVCHRKKKKILDILFLRKILLLTFYTQGFKKKNFVA